MTAHIIFSLQNKKHSRTLLKLLTQHSKTSLTLQQSSALEKGKNGSFFMNFHFAKMASLKNALLPMHTLSFSALSFSFRQCLFISWWWERNWWCLWHLVLLQLVLIGSIYHLYITLEVQRLFLDFFPQSSVLVGVHNQRVYLLKVVFDLPGYYLRMDGYISPPWTPRPDIELVKQLLSKPKVGFAQGKVVGRTGK